MKELFIVTLHTKHAGDRPDQRGHPIDGPRNSARAGSRFLQSGKGTAPSVAAEAARARPRPLVAVQPREEGGGKAGVSVPVSGACICGLVRDTAALEQTTVGYAGG